MTLRPSVCSTHHLRRRCPGCEHDRKGEGIYPALEVPVGTAEWLRNAALVFADMGDEGAVAFTEWVCVDLRETA